MNDNDLEEHKSFIDSFSSIEMYVSFIFLFLSLWKIVDIVNWIIKILIL